MVAKSTKQAEVAFTPREPNDRDKAAIAFAGEGVLAQRRRASIHLAGTNASVAIQSPHGDGPGHQHQLLDVLGTSSNDFMKSALAILLNALSERSSVAQSATADHYRH